MYVYHHYYYTFAQWFTFPWIQYYVVLSSSSIIIINALVTRLLVLLSLHCIFCGLERESIINGNLHDFQETQCHEGTKATKVVYLGDTGRLITTGFSRYSDRQFAVWDQKNLSKPLALVEIDSSSGILFPFYDHDTRVLYLAGKGDGNIRYYEIVDHAPWAHYLNQFPSGFPQVSIMIANLLEFVPSNFLRLDIETLWN